MGKYLQFLKKIDWILMITVLFLFGIGLIAIYSVDLSSDVTSALSYQRQLLFAGIGIGLMFLFSFVDYRSLRSYSWYIYGFGILMLLFVLFFGATVRGTQGWFNIFGLRFQPVEFAKFIVIIYLAKYLADWANNLDEFRYVVLSGMGVFFPFLLVMLQPDFGSGMVMFFVWFGLLVVSGFKWSHMLRVGIILVAMIAFAWMFLFADYQKQRVMTFLDPASDPLGRGYNINQSIIATGSGRLFGRGVGLGSQSQLKFLPESQTDFIFAVVGEELGFAGASLLLALVMIFFYRLFVATRMAKDDFSMFLLLGISLLFFVHFFINISMNIGMAPVTGISLPFVSYGGSFLVMSFILVGVVQSIIVRSKA